MNDNELMKIVGGGFNFGINTSFGQLEDCIDGFVDGISGHRRDYRKNS